jgi:LacI family transcriptional regulator, repressor for deo operon, udp, cdd, tsx, nupC, and nupG
MGFAAVRALVDEINGFGAPRSEYLFAPELVVRGSTAIAAERRATVSRKAPAALSGLPSHNS